VLDSTRNPDAQAHRHSRRRAAVATAQTLKTLRLDFAQQLPRGSSFKPEDTERRNE